jgi:hypothetical protein
VRASGECICRFSRANPDGVVWRPPQQRTASAL